MEERTDSEKQCFGEVRFEELRGEQDSAAPSQLATQPGGNLSDEQI